MCGISGALTSCHRGYKRSPASFLRPFCKQESHKAPAEAEGDLWERISFSYINEKAQCTFRMCWAGTSQPDGREGSAWREQRAAKWEEVQQPWGRTSPQRSTKFRLVVARAEVFPLRLLQSPHFSKAKLTQKSSQRQSWQLHSSSSSPPLQICIHIFQDTCYCWTMIFEIVEQR